MALKVVHDKMTKDFALINKDGEIVTCFKVGVKYWAKKLKEAASAASSSVGGTPL
jgi:hypothetical protein